MGDTIEHSSDPIPGECCVCGREDDADGDTVWELVEDGEEIPPEDWYLHLHDTEADGIVLRQPEVYLFCPDCSPEDPLPTADENPDFDMDKFVDRWREELDC